jgi:hypothetical protein
MALSSSSSGPHQGRDFSRRQVRFVSGQGQDSSPHLALSAVVLACCEFDQAQCLIFPWLPAAQRLED